MSFADTRPPRHSHRHSKSGVQIICRQVQGLLLGGARFKLSQTQNSSLVNALFATVRHLGHRCLSASMEMMNSE